jgi:hypothetical protein
MDVQKLSVITEICYIRGSVKLRFKTYFKLIPLKLRLFSVLLHMGMNRYILHIQKHILGVLHSWTLDVADRSTKHQDAWMLYTLVGLLSASDPSDAKTCTWKHAALKRDEHPCLWRDSNSQSQQANGRRPTPYTARSLGSSRIFSYCTYSHLIGRPALTRITSWPKNPFRLRTVNKILTKSLPKILQVNAPKSSHNWFMTGHSTPSAIKMLECGNYGTFSPVHEQNLSGSDCPGLSILTTNGWTLSRKAKQNANFTSLHGVSGYKMLSNYICSLHVTLTSATSALERNVTVFNCLLCCQKGYSRGKSTV